MKSVLIYSLIILVMATSLPTYAGTCSDFLARIGRLKDTALYHLRNGRDKAGAIQDLQYFVPNLDPTLIDYLRSMDHFTGTRFSRAEHNFRGRKTVDTSTFVFVMSNQEVIVMVFLTDLGFKTEALARLRTLPRQHSIHYIAEVEGASQSSRIGTHTFSISARGSTADQIRFLKALEQGLRHSGG